MATIMSHEQYWEAVQQREKMIEQEARVKRLLLSLWRECPGLRLYTS
jgi:hypothetical protein